MTEYGIKVTECLLDWAQKLKECNGDTQCLEECSKDLRRNLDLIFPPSTKLEFEQDKINYVFSTIFFLSNRLTKTIIGLSEIDKAIDGMTREEKQNIKFATNDESFDELEDKLNQILAKYY